MQIPKAAQAVLAKVPRGLASRLERLASKLPIVGDLLRAEQRKIGESLKAQVRAHRPTELQSDELPAAGVEPGSLLEVLRRWASAEAPAWRDGKMSGGVYHGGEAHLRLLEQVYGLYSQANPLHADVWPSVARFESDVVRFTARLLHGNPSHPDDAQAVCGTLSSGGTESIMLALKTYRDFGRAERGIRHGEVVVPSSAHPAFDKGAHTLGVKLVRVPVGSDGRADVARMEAALSRDTLVCVGSAPSFPHGLVDPIEALSAMAHARGVPFHTDACLGGFILAFAQDAGFPAPRFDFELPGVTSVSIDTHKFGYAAKGTSVVLYRGKHLRRHQYFTTPDWSGGLYATPGFAGSRPGALIAQAWTTMMTLGREGYVRNTKAVLETAAVLKAGIARIEGLRVVGDPLWVVAFTSDRVDVFRVLDELAKRGWSLNGLQHPPAVHLCVTLRHAEPGVAERFLADLAEAVRAVKDVPVGEGGMAPIYGLAASLPFKGVVSDVLAAYVDALYDA